MEKLNITFLSTEQMDINSNKFCNILKERGTKAALTDFSILLGGIPSNSEYVNDEEKLENRTGCYWTLTPYECFSSPYKDAYTIDWNGGIVYDNADNRRRGARLITKPTDVPTWNIEKTHTIIEKEFGEYPQQAVTVDIEAKLEKLYNSGVLELCETRNSYTTDSTYKDSLPFVPKTHIEYEYKGKKYIRVIVNSDRKTILSNGREYYNGDAAWIEVQPIKWLVDEDADIAVTEKLIFAGIQFHNERNYDGNFNRTNIKQFIDRIFSVDMISPKVEVKQENKPNFNLQPETRKSQIIEANIVYKEGSNMTLVLPYEILENIDTITLESKIGEEKQVVYVKKQQNNQ